MALMEETNLFQVHTGLLYKRGAVNKAWRERYFVLRQDRILEYYENKTDEQPKGRIDLGEVQSMSVVPHRDAISTVPQTPRTMDDEVEASNARQTPHSDIPHTFELVTPRRVYLLAASTTDELTRWLAEFQHHIFGMRLHSGWLIKRGAYRKTWKKRFFVVYDTLEMRYYTDESTTKALGNIKLDKVLLMCPGERDQYQYPYSIQLMTTDRNWVLACESLEERQQWCQVFEDTISEAKRLVTSHEGVLLKQGSQVHRWRERYFALSRGWLFYFEGKFHCDKFKSITFFQEDFFNEAFKLYVKGSIRLNDAQIVRIGDYDEQSFVFQIRTEQRSFHFACEDEKDMNEWMHAFVNTDPIRPSMDSSTASANVELILEQKVSRDHSAVIGFKSQTHLSIEGLSDDDAEPSKSGSREVNVVQNLFDPDGSGRWMVDVEDENFVEQQRSYTLVKKGSSETG